MLLVIDLKIENVIKQFAIVFGEVFCLIPFPNDLNDLNVLWIVERPSCPFLFSSENCFRVVKDEAEAEKYGVTQLHSVSESLNYLSVIRLSLISCLKSLVSTQVQE